MEALLSRKFGNIAKQFFNFTELNKLDLEIVFVSQNCIFFDFI